MASSSSSSSSSSPRSSRAAARAARSDDPASRGSAKRRLPDRDLPILPPPDEPGPFEPRVPGIDYGVLDGLTGYAFRRAQIAIYADFIRSLAPWQITPPRFAAMVLISCNPNLKLTQLASIMGIARSGAVMLIDTLEEMGHVVRRPARDDRRAFSLELTAQGRRTLDAVTQAVRKHDERIASALTLEERELFVKMLGRLALCAR